MVYAKKISFQEELLVTPKKSDNTTNPPNKSRLGLVFNLFKILIIVGKYLPLIFVAFAGISLALALNDFTRGNYGWAIVNSAFVLGDLAFLIEWYQRRKIRTVGYQHALDRMEPLTVKVPTRETKRIILKKEVEEELSPLILSN